MRFDSSAVPSQNPLLVGQIPNYDIPVLKRSREESALRAEAEIGEIGHRAVEARESFRGASAQDPHPAPTVPQRVTVKVRRQRQWQPGVIAGGWTVVLFGDIVQRQSGGGFIPQV